MDNHKQQELAQQAFARHARAPADLNELDEHEIDEFAALGAADLDDEESATRFERLFCQFTARVLHDEQERRQLLNMQDKDGEEPLADE